MKRCEDCGHTVRCCEDDCPICGGQMLDERDMPKGCMIGTQ